MRLVLTGHSEGIPAPSELGSQGWGARRWCDNGSAYRIGGLMPISELLLLEFDDEMKKTRTTLERVPVDKPEFAPHPKSMPLGRLAPHVAQLCGFGLTILTTPQFDFSQGSFKPLPLESVEQLVRVLDEGAAKTRSALASLPADAWNDNWKLAVQ